MEAQNQLGVFHAKSKGLNQDSDRATGLWGSDCSRNY